jgi:hypothetical protein
MCPNLESVFIPEGVQNVYSSAFYECVKLRTVSFPKSAKCYGLYAFYNCKALTDVYYGGTQDEWIDFSDHTSSYNTPLLQAPNVHFAHVHDYTVEESAATCEMPGSRTEVCVCSDRHSTMIPALGHDWDEGTVTKEPTYTEEGEMTYTCKNDPSHTKTEVIPKLEKCDGGDACPSKDFTDVDHGPDSWSHEPIDWAVVNKITVGTSATTFSPNNECTRGEAVTFLWRAAGRPEPETTENPFTDVADDAFYLKPVLWAVENGITVGTGNNQFSPNEKCTRSQIVSFLWRMHGKPAAAEACAFDDVPADAWYFDAVSWAVEKGITKGTSNTTFEPDAFCIRSQIVAFLYRDQT